MVMNCHKIWSDIKLIPSCISFHTYFIKFHIPLSLYSFCGSKTADTNELVFTSELTFPVRLDGLIKFSHQQVWLIVYLASLCMHSDIYFHNCLIINQNNKPESRLSFWFYKSFSKLHAVLKDHVVSMRWKTWHNTQSSDWPKWKQKAPFHWSKLTPACTYVTLEFDQNKVKRGQKVILVQQRKQAKIGFETFRSKYIKLCVSSDVGKKEIRSERKWTCFLRRSNIRFLIRALSINKLELRK